MKKLMIGTAIGALMMSGALAQSPTSPASKPSANSTASPPAAAQNAPTGGKADIVMSQKPDQWLATKFRGTDVIGADNKKIGDVSDLLFDKSGKIIAYVVSVGGFLGMGAKEVALAPSSFEVVPGKSGSSDQLKLSMNKNELKQAQNFTPYAPPHATTTGSGAGSGGLGGLSGGMRPSTNAPHGK